MPTYDYECGGCGHAFEVFESLHAQGLRECPKCGKKQAKRLLGIGAGLVFKGSGFYVTDYKRSGGNASETPAKSEKKSETSSENRKT
jgi:putative FmdB family regulatory protein